MQNNETWLIHSELLNQWKWHRSEWVRSLGWADDMYKTLISDFGWHIFGNAELHTRDYIDIICAENPEGKMYKYTNGKWDYIHGPVLFVYRKNPQESFIAGYAGPYKLICELEDQYSNPWEWPSINIIEVEPVVAIQSHVKKQEKLPVIFMSNGETNADVNWTTLKHNVPHAIRLDGISGRRRAFHEAAKLAGDATHFFVVTGKNEITKPEIFEYRPDSSKIGTKHVVFLAKNMSNDLISGHMAIGCYNKDTVLNTPVDFGLDFTEAGGIVTVPILASKAHFSTSMYEAWRTAFREAVKLTLRGDDPVAKSQLERWKNYAHCMYAEYVMIGAEEGNWYALNNLNNREALKKTVEWDWLKEYYDSTARLLAK